MESVITSVMIWSFINKIEQMSIYFICVCVCVYYDETFLFFTNSHMFLLFITNVGERVISRSLVMSSLSHV